MSNTAQYTQLTRQIQLKMTIKIILMILKNWGLGGSKDHMKVILSYKSFNDLKISKCFLLLIIL